MEAGYLFLTRNSDGFGGSPIVPRNSPSKVLPMPARNSEKPPDYRSMLQEALQLGG